MVFDKTSIESFQNVSMWYEEISKYSENPIRMIVGNKDDAKEMIQVDYEQAHKFAADLKMNYVETSALNSHQVAHAFESISKELIMKKQDKVETGEKLIKQDIKQVQNCCSKL